MNRRDRDLERWAQTAYRHDDIRSYQTAERMVHVREDRRRDRRNAVLLAVIAVGPIGWLAAVAAVLVGCWLAVAWIDAHRWQTVIALSIISVIVYKAMTRRGPVEAHYTDEAPGAALIQATIEPVQHAHAGLAAALPAGYRDAVEAGTIQTETVEAIANGVRYVVPLPARVTADQFKARAFAGAQGIPENRVRRAPGEHPGVLLVDLLDSAPEDLPTPPWPLLSGALVDFTRPVPVGVTTAGEVVEATFAANRCIYGGKSNSGKTWAMRLPVIAAALDPKVRLFVVDMKAETDWLPFERVADVFLNSGDHDEAARIVREVVAERRKRARMKRENPGFVPAPLVLVIDEFHNLPEWDALTELVKEGRSTGITVILGTQAPKGSKIPTDLTAQMNVRWCGKMNIDWQWRLVLGDELNRDDIDTTKVAGKGSAWIIDDEDNADLIRGFKVADDDIVKALARVPARNAADDNHGDVQDTLSDDEDDERAPAELAAEDLLIEIGDRASLTLDEAREVIGAAELAILRAALPSGNNGTDDKVKRNGVTVPGIRKERLQRFLNL